MRTKPGAVTIKAMTDDTVTLAGYGVIFGGVDLEGETFERDTDYMLDLVPTKLVLYDHGLNPQMKTAVIGRVRNESIKIDDIGLWIEAELDRHEDYIAAVIELANRGALGWSSGSVGHLTQRAGKSITSWPIIEFSLTPTPAEPRTIGVEMLKALAGHAELDPAITELSTDESPDSPVDIEDESEEPEAELSQDAPDASATAADADDDSHTDEAIFTPSESDLLALEISFFELENT